MNWVIADPRNRVEYLHVLKQFLRTVRHIFAYQTTQDEEMWLDWSTRLSPNAFLVWLAGHVADELCENKPWRVSADELIESIDRESSGLLQHEAERFLQRTYFTYTPFCPQQRRMTVVFRRLVQRRIRRRLVYIAVSVSGRI